MSAKIIPFGIAVNSKRYSTPLRWAVENHPMESQTVEKTLEELARERDMDVFKPDGTLNQSALARELTRRGKQPVNQPFLTRLIKGSLTGKESTLRPIAAGFNMSVTELVAKLRPETATAPVVSLPPEAVELWELWKQLPREARNYFTEQIKNVIATRKRYPELSAAISAEAQKAANDTRVDRQRKRSG